MEIRQYIKMAFQNLILPAVYRLCCLRRVDPSLVVFADAHHDSRPENLQLLYERCAGTRLTVAEIYLDYQKNPPLKVFGSMLAFMRLYARAGTVVICDNFLPVAGCKKRAATKVVQLWHACGSLKRFGYDTTDDIPAAYRGNVFRNTDLVTVSAPRCEKPFASAMRLPLSHVKALGVSRTDRYFDPAWRALSRARFAKAFPEAAGKKIALWAPTFRGSPAAPKSIPFDVSALERALGEDWKVIVSTHPHMKDGRVRVTTEELFVAADCLIADYSSLLFEYLLVAKILEEEPGQKDKRLVMYTPDYEDYVSRRGFYMPYEDIPGVRVGTFDELAGAVLGKAGKMQGMERDAFLETYMAACDGKSTKRILKWILRKR